MRVLLIDQGADRSTPVAARALHRDGWIVGVGSPFRGLGQASRFVHRRHTIPAAETSAAELIEAVSTAVREEGYDVVFSPDDAGVLALSLYRDRVGAVVPWANHDVVLRALDKLELTKAADRVGLHTPYTIEGTDAAIREWKGAAIVKPRLHTTLLPGEPGRLAAVMVEDREAAARRCAELLAHRAQPIVQEIIGGTLMSLVLLADRGGRIVALVQQRSEHSYPRHIGVTARGHTIAVDRDLAIRAEALLRDLEWFGLAQLQFIEPLDGGPPRLLDLNGRFYGSLALALGGGVNLPALWARLATGRPVPEGVHEASAGARFQWLSRDLRWAWQQAGVARFFGIADTLALVPRASHSVWQANDPWPAFSFLGGKLWRSGLQLLARPRGDRC